MAFTDLGSIASGGSSGNNQATLTVATTASCAAGVLVVVAVCDDNRVTGGGDDLAVSGVTIGTAAPFALAKARQNATNLAAQAGSSVSLWWGVLPYAIASGQNIVATFTNASLSDATALSARAFSFASLLNEVAVEATNATTGTTTNPGSLDATTANIACLRIRAIGCEYDTTQTITGTGSFVVWAEGGSAATGTITEQVVECVHIISTGTGNASAPTLGSACDSASVYVAFKELPIPFWLPALDVPQRPRRSIDLVTWVRSAITAAAPEVVYQPGWSQWFNPWGPKQPVRDWAWFNPNLTSAAIPPDTENLPAAAANWFNPWGPQQPVRDWTWPGLLPVPVVLAAGSSPSGYSLTGASATFSFGQAAEAGNYTASGTAASLALGQVAGGGAYAVSGNTAALATGHVAGAGAYSITGSASAAALGHVAEAGAYGVLGGDVTLALGYVTGGGAYTLVGSDAQLTVLGATTLVCEAGAYALTGSDAALTVPGAVSYLPAGMTGGYAPWGLPPRDYWIWLVAYQPYVEEDVILYAGGEGEYVGYILVGSDADLIVSAGDQTLSAESGSYALAGSDAALTVTEFEYVFRQPLVTRIWAPPPPRDYWIWSVAYQAAPGDVTLSAASGSYTLVGSDAALVTTGGDQTLSAESGNYILVGSDAALTATVSEYIFRQPLVTRYWPAPPRDYWVWSVAYRAADTTISAAPGAYALAGSDIQFTVTGPITLVCEAGGYSLAGSAATLALGFGAAAGAYALTGSAATTATGFVVAAAAGSYSLVGSDAQFAVVAGSITLVCEAGSYNLAGSPVTFLGADGRPVGAGGGGRRWRWRRIRKRREWEEFEELLKDVLPPDVVAEPAPTPRIRARVIRRHLLSTTSQQLEDLLDDIEARLPPPEAALGEILRFDPGLIRLDSLPQISSPPLQLSDEDEDEIALLLAVLLVD